MNRDRGNDLCRSRKELLREAVDEEGQGKGVRRCEVAIVYYRLLLSLYDRPSF